MLDRTENSFPFASPPIFSSINSTQSIVHNSLFFLSTIDYELLTVDYFADNSPLQSDTAYHNGELSLSPSKESLYKEILGCYNITGLDSKRFFVKESKQTLYANLETGSRGKKICPECKKEFSFDDFQIDHRNPWSKGGQTILSNAQLLCINCNKKKGNKT